MSQKLCSIAEWQKADETQRFEGFKRMRKKVHQNEMFRVLECHMSIEETAKLCDVSLMQVKKWDSGKSPIPEIKRKLMEMHRCLKMDHLQWEGWFISNGTLHSPMGFKFKPQMLECLAIMHTTDRKDWLVRKTEYAARHYPRQKRRQRY